MTDSYTTTADSDSTNDSANQSDPDTPQYVSGSGGDHDLIDRDQQRIQRDENGEIIPRREYVEELGGDAIAKPLPRSARERYIEETLGQGEDVTDAMLAELFDEYLVVPDLTTWEGCPNDRVTEEFVTEGLTQAEEDAFFFAILLASGDHDLVDRLRSNRRGGLSENEIALLDQLGPERMQELMEETGVEEGQGN